MMQQVKVQKWGFDRETGKSFPDGEIEVTIEIDVEKLADLMFHKGRKTLASGLIRLKKGFQLTKGKGEA